MASKNLKVRVNVTQKNITKGVCGDSDLCAIAQALIDTKLFTSVSVGGFGVSAERRKKTGGGRFLADLPKRAASFIDKFDEDKTTVKPFSFTLLFKPRD